MNLQDQASIIMKGSSRMHLLKNNFKNSFKGIILYPRCEKETDNEEHLFGKYQLWATFT